MANVGPAPRFDEIRHAVICTELKNLYVGLTPARNHCWIWDVSGKAEPMKLFWRKQGLIKECGPNDPMPQLSVSSTEADWAKSGRLLFNKRLYPQAMFCFEKANLLVERDIASAYESRKQARLLQAAKSVDRTTRRAAFSRAASDFLGCAFLSKAKQQTSCYLRAAECYLQAEDWKAAAEAFYSAHDFDMAARNFRRAGCFDEAVDVVKKHRSRVQNNVAEDILGVARLEYFRTNKLEKASGLFEEVDEQLEYMEDYGFTGALIRVLEHHRRYDQAAEVAFTERNVTEGVRLLSKSSNPISVQKATEQALRGLWTMIPFGLTGDKRSNPAISLLIDQLSLNATLSDEESRELEAFRALYANNVEGLLDLAQSNQTPILEPKDQTSSGLILQLLCFSHSSRLLTPHRNSTISEFIHKAKTALKYVGQLLLFTRSLDISLIDTQKLLGFEPVEPTGLGQDKTHSVEFWIHSTSLLFESAQGILGDTVPNTSALGLLSLAITESDTRRLALDIMYDMIRSEARKMHLAANTGFYLSPCLDFAIFGRCNRAECGRQEVNSRDLPFELRQDLYNQRTRALIIQTLIVNCYQAHSTQDEHERRDFRRIWARKLYENLMPHFPPLGSIVCVDARRIPELGDSTGAISAWCEDALHELDPVYGAPNKFLSDVLAYLDISFRIHRQDYIFKLHSRRLVRPRDDLMIDTIGPIPGKYSIVHDFINFYIRKSPNVIARAIRAVFHIVFKSLAIEANVLVNFLEFVGREIIVFCRLSQKGGVFHNILLPRSWASDLVKRTPLPLQQGISLREYMATLYRTLELLRVHEPKSSPLYGFNGPLGLVLRSVLIMRVCRLIVLVANNAQFSYPMKDETRRAIARSLTGPGDIHTSLCTKFMRADSWQDLWNAVRYSQLNRGADELVHLFLRQDNVKPPSIGAVKLIVYSNLNPELEKLLSLVEPDITLDPRAKPFIPQIRNLSPMDGEEQTIESSQVTVDDELSAELLDSGLVTSDGDLPSVSQSEPKPPLTDLEIASGKKILHFFRRYTSRQLIKMTTAIRTIWAYYLRHRLRHKVPMSATEEQIRKLHNEYKIDVESIDCPLLYAKAFHNHERILLGFMPHVSVYLRGLERVNQQQKEVNKKRLQKVQHEELEKVRIKMDACAKLAKKIKALSHRIAPGSAVLHQIDTLRAEVKKVDALRTEIMSTFGEDVISKLEEQYSLGVGVILAPSPVATAPKPSKPVLNVSDLTM
ncbi:unnamed protein product [Rhizoctonia solani]|uniref:Uncharacterized protein n=1 Tax=Rhizoctonia solani TaxID=456999 RepID=A0A8H2WMF2_9AGAM|nr:unnamed protein product [Rhizoctonia solani]